jgi:putative phosphoesterase
MKKIGILSDTHAYIDDRIFEHFACCDQLWHCGDWGSMEVVNKFQNFKALQGVWGNIDGYDIRQIFPKHNRFICEGADVWLTHIGGYPGKYDSEVMPEIFNNPPQLFVCGHSHILKIKFDKRLNVLHINPGAAGKYGFHLVQTLVRLDIDNGEFKNLEVIELQKT